MRPYISDYISTLSTRRAERVGALLEEARVGKEQLDAISDRLQESFLGYANASLRTDKADGRIESGVLASNLRDIALRISDMYSASNLISVLLESHSALLSSDVKAIEDELIAMEKMALNFAFLLSDNQAYDYAHLEPFSDVRGRDEESRLLSDRTGSYFSEREIAVVRPSEGILALPQEVTNSHGLTAAILKGNSTGFILSDSGLKNVLKRGSTTGWHMKIAAPSPITGSLPEGKGVAGAQVLLEFRLTQPSPSSEIKLVPFSDIPIDILQITVYDDDDDSNGETLLSGTRKLDRPATFHFPIRSISRFHVLINQPTYHRQDRKENESEVSYLASMREVLDRRSIDGPIRNRSYSIRKLERTLQREANKGADYFATSIPNSELTPRRGPVSSYKLFLNMKYNKSNVWKDANGKMQDIMYGALRGFSYDLDVKQIYRNAGDTTANKRNRSLYGRPAPQVVEPKRRIMETNFNYRYNLGLYFVGVGVESPQYKGVFISKPLPAPGDIGEIRIKAGIDNYSVPVSQRLSKSLTSVEVSVSNESNPESENDWIPILPVDAGNRIEGERLFLSEVGIAMFRFPALAGQVFIIYRNGHLVNQYKEIRGRPGEIKGVFIDTYQVNQDEVFTCDYYPAGDPTVVKLEPYGFNQIPLVSAFDTTGSGEKFLSTGDRNTVTLSHQPYIDPEASQADTYTPIIVRFEDGTVAINVTDYKSNQQGAFPADSGYYYIHSGNTLLFNKTVSKAFRVYYQYLQNNVRFRVVLRCNVRDFVSPKVDYIHVKAKTRRPDQRRL